LLKVLKSIEFLSRAKFWLGYAAVVGALIVAMYTVVSLRLDALRAEHAKPRVLTQQQHSILVKRLRKTPGGFILVASLAGDEESYNFSQQIYEVLKESGWDARFVGATLFPINPKGLAIFVRSPAPPAIDPR
jgi:hypothetical protein